MIFALLYTKLRPMPFIQTPIEGLIVFEPSVFHDERGYFFESYNRKTWKESGIDIEFVQDNQAHSTQVVLR